MAVLTQASSARGSPQKRADSPRTARASDGSRREFPMAKTHGD